MRIRRVGLALAVAMAASVAAAPARADLLIQVDKSAQQMTVTQDGVRIYVWPVSTGAAGYDTPSGQFKPFRMEADHFSKEWDDAPMPHSIFFTMQGHAIHGSNHLKAIGTPASHGCVRLEPKNAAVLFALVKAEHMSNTRVVLMGETPAAGGAVARRNRGNDYQRSFTAGGDDFTDTMAPPPPTRRQRGARYYDDQPRNYYYGDRPFFAPPPRYGYREPAPYPYYSGR